MKELTCQKKKNKLIVKFDEDIEELNNFKDNQLLRVTVIGNDKDRSLTQLGLYWACCRMVALNTEDFNWNHKNKVSDQALIGAGWVDYRIVTPTGNVIVKPKSISFRNLGHIKANGILTEALEIMATFLKISLFELIENAKDTMG